MDEVKSSSKRANIWGICTACLCSPSSRTHCLITGTPQVTFASLSSPAVMDIRRLRRRLLEKIIHSSLKWRQPFFTFLPLKRFFPSNGASLFLPFYLFTFLPLKRFSLPTAPAFFYLFTFKKFFPSNGVSLFYLFTFLPLKILFTFKSFCLFLY